MTRLLKNFLSVLIGRAAGHGLTVIASIYLARVLSPEAYGVVGFLTSYASFFMLLATLGIPVYGARELARITDPSEKSRFTGAWISINLAFAIASYVLFTGSLWLLRFEPLIRRFGVVWGLRLILSGASCYWLFQAHEKMGLVGLRDLLKGMIFCISVVLLIKSPDQLLNVAWLSSGSVLIGELFLLTLVFSNLLGFVPKPVLHQRRSSGSLKDAARIGLILLMAQIYYRTDSVLLHFIKDDEHVGLYTAMYQLIFVGESIAVLYFASILPRISTLWQNNREKLSDLMDFSMSVFVVIGCLLGVLGLLFSRNIIQIIYGADYASSSRAFAILVWSMVITYAALTPVYFLLGTRYQKECSHATIMAAIVNLVLNFPLIIYYGIYGAAVATVAAKATEFVYVFRKTNEKMTLNWELSRILKLAGAVVMTVGVGALTHRYELILPLNAAVVSASYFTMILGLKVISIRELKAVLMKIH